ncbi:type I restriction-modification enzyme R subunit C-terminal domain-containing protein [Caproicibacter sp.]|uniref:type I restriction endonuclease subunit R n=1 Tax=Caproicibacter sp. TaxID=2814884 RepID=UPI003989F7F8
MPEEKARIKIDQKLIASGWIVQDRKQFNPLAGIGVAVREYPTSTGAVDYALFVEGTPVGVVEAKKSEVGENITAVEEQSYRYAKSTFQWAKSDTVIRFAYEATDVLTRFTDYADEKYRSRPVFTFHRPETLRMWLAGGSATLRNNMKRFPSFDTTGFRDCQITAIKNLERSFAENRPRALIQMATGAGKTFTAITSVSRLLKFAKANRILFLVDTKGLGEQAEREFLAYRPSDDFRTFSEIYSIRRLKTSHIPKDAQVCISTIQRMYSILRGEELNEHCEETSLNEVKIEGKPKEVVYNESYPPEMFDVIIIDECHRSIYNVWQQVLDYFDSFLVGLTATPDKRTFGFFQQNVVSEYSHEQAVIDDVNVNGDLYTIETEIGKNGATILKQFIERRSRLSRRKRWEQMDEDVIYKSIQLDRDIVNPSQIRTVIKAFHNAMFTELFPGRKEVPKTLVFAKTDSHADDIIQIVREEFGQGNEFCRKITYQAENPESVLSAFRNDYYPRIAVTVDMIATGTDVKPIECLLFMRDVKSKNYFEQMKGRGTRTLCKDDLQKVTPSAVSNKTHYVLVDAVGVTRTVKTDSRPLERKPTVALKDLMMSVALGIHDEDTLTSLANRLTRLNKELTPKEQKTFQALSGGMTVKSVVQNLLEAFDPDVIESRASSLSPEESETDEQRQERAQETLIAEAVKPFYLPEVRQFVEDARKNHDQIIDTVNVDTVTFSGWDAQQMEKAEETIRSFRHFIEENKDEIIALRILYSETYQNRAMTIEKMKALYEKLTAAPCGMTVERLWECYAVRKPGAVRGKSTMRVLADLVSLIRFEMGYADTLSPFADTVNYNFMRWTMAKNAGHIHFSEEQMEWLRLIKDHIAVSLSAEPDDLELTPFDEKGGLGRYYELFGSEYLKVLQEMNEALVA